MTTHIFKVSPGVTAPAGAPDIPLVNIRPSMEPVGPIKTIIDSLTGTYNAYEKAHIAQAWFNAFDAGLVGDNGVLDTLHLMGRTSNDLLLNFRGNGIVPVNVGATFNASKGFVFDGVDDYLRTGVVPGTAGLKYTLNDASLGFYLPNGEAIPSSGYVTGATTSGNQPCALQPNRTTKTQVSLLLNGPQLLVNYAGTRNGVWGGNRVNSTTARITLDGAVIGSSNANAVSAVPNSEIVFGRQSSTYGAIDGLGGWYVGDTLTAQQESDAAAIIKDHFARFAA